MKRIDQLIPTAITAIKNNHIADKKGHVPNEFKGYIDTFGASIVQNGLIPAIIFFETAGGKPDESFTTDPEKKGIFENRNKLIKAILQVILENDKISSSSAPHTLFKYVKDREEEKMAVKQIRQKVVDAAIAVKMALRTFAITQSDDHEQPKQ